MKLKSGSEAQLGKNFALVQAGGLCNRLPFQLGGTSSPRVAGTGLV